MVSSACPMCFRLVLSRIGFMDWLWEQKQRDVWDCIVQEDQQALLEIVGVQHGLDPELTIADENKLLKQRVASLALDLSSVYLILVETPPTSDAQGLIEKLLSVPSVKRFQDKAVMLAKEEMKTRVAQSAVALLSQRGTLDQLTAKLKEATRHQEQTSELDANLKACEACCLDAVPEIIRAEAEQSLADKVNKLRGRLDIEKAQGIAAAEEANRMSQDLAESLQPLLNQGDEVPIMYEGTTVLCTVTQWNPTPTRGVFDHAVFSATLPQGDMPQGDMPQAVTLNLTLAELLDAIPEQTGADDGPNCALENDVADRTAETDAASVTGDKVGQGGSSTSRQALNLLTPSRQVSVAQREASAGDRAEILGPEAGAQSRAGKADASADASAETSALAVNDAPAEGDTTTKAANGSGDATTKAANGSDGAADLNFLTERLKVATRGDTVSQGGSITSRQDLLLPTRSPAVSVAAHKESAHDRAEILGLEAGAQPRAGNAAASAATGAAHDDGDAASDAAHNNDSATDAAATAARSAASAAGRRAKMVSHAGKRIMRSFAVGVLVDRHGLTPIYPCGGMQEMSGWVVGERRPDGTHPVIYDIAPGDFKPCDMADLRVNENLDDSSDKSFHFRPKLDDTGRCVEVIWTLEELETEDIQFEGAVPKVPTAMMGSVIGMSATKHITHYGILIGTRRSDGTVRTVKDCEYIENLNKRKKDYPDTVKWHDQQAADLAKSVAASRASTKRKDPPASPTVATRSRTGGSPTCSQPHTPVKKRLTGRSATAVAANEASLLCSVAIANAQHKVDTTWLPNACLITRSCLSILHHESMLVLHITPGSGSHAGRRCGVAVRHAWRRRRPH